MFSSATPAKASTGIAGLDEITLGGLPQGRVALVCGGPGDGKSLLAMQFLVSGASESGEPGVFVSFEETASELVANAASLNWGLASLVERGLLEIEHVRVDPGELNRVGEYDLEALFIRLDHAIAAVGAKRVALDSVEKLFGGLGDESLLRGELQRLFAWLKDRGVTAVVTAERGANTLTRHGLEEYLSDCVILLDHRVEAEVSTRRLRIVKYRGSSHGSNEYPFTIDADGFSVFPLTSVELKSEAPTTRVNTGVPRLDEMLGGGYFSGSTVLVSGGPGSGKTSLAGVFVSAACRRGERCLYLALEESASQLTRNLTSIGVEFDPFLRDGTLEIVPRKPSESGLETHLAVIHKAVSTYGPTTVIIDPLSAFAGQHRGVKSMLARLIDFLKMRGITVLLTTLIKEDDRDPIGISSLVDTWLLLSHHEFLGERNRGILVQKSRGSTHSHQRREFLLGNSGIEIVDAYAGAGGLLMGSARVEAQQRDLADRLERDRMLEAAARRSGAAQAVVLAQIAALEAQLETDRAATDAEMEDRLDRGAVLAAEERARLEVRSSSGGPSAGPP
ncbi:circadian clock protein KaiC [Nocardioides psychrotolerans]|nr:circadian clock protein KaiC [Nocardioides psychrotolerans]